MIIDTVVTPNGIESRHGREGHDFSRAVRQPNRLGLYPLRQFDPTGGEADIGRIFSAHNPA